MKLIVGLGNPGKQYKNTWHNVGFAVLDLLHKHNRSAFSNFSLNKKWNAEIAEGTLGSEKVILAKPQTFMNNSGEAVGALARYYKIDSADVWIAHDEVDLLLGAMRISANASAGGHNGVKSIIEHLGNQEFVRFRVGIRVSPTLPVPTEEYVLQTVDKKSSKVLQQKCADAVAAIELAATNGIAEAMNRYN